MRSGNRGRDMPTPVPGSLKNVVITNIVARNAYEACILAGIPGHPVESITLENVRVVYRGASKAAEADVSVPENVAKYPNSGMFGPLPAYGLYCRHAKDVQLSRVNVSCLAADQRHGVYCEDVADITLDSLEAIQAEGAVPIIRLHNVHDAVVRGCLPKKGTREFLRVTGADSTGIRMMSNDFSKVEKPVSLDADVTQDAVSAIGNAK